MRVLFDINVVLDFLCKRGGFYKDTTLLFDMAVKNKFKAYLSSDSIPTLYYLYDKVYRESKRSALAPKEAMSIMLDVFEVVSLEKQQHRDALEETIDDFEDAIKYIAARKAECDYLVTRDKTLLDHKIKRKDKLKIIAPEQLLAMCS